MNKKKGSTIIISLVLILISLRLALPYYLKYYVNDVISNLSGYHGKVEGVGLSLYRGAYQFEGLELYKIENKENYPLFNAQNIDISLHWGALFEGRIVAEIFLDDFFVDIDAGPRSKVNSVKNIKEIKKTDETMWLKSLRALVPIRINVIGLKRGRVIIAKGDQSNKVIFSFKDLNGKLTNLRNKDEVEPSLINLKARVFSEGFMSIDGEMSLLSEFPQYNFKASIEKVPLINVNYFARKYAFLDFEGGDLNIYSQIKTTDKKIEGYIKPILNHVEVFKLGEEEGFLNTIWQGMAAVFMNIFENSKNDQVASVIPIEGVRKSPDTDNWQGILNLLKNAFVEAYEKGFQDSDEIKVSSETHFK